MKLRIRADDLPVPQEHVGKAMADCQTHHILRWSM